MTSKRLLALLAAASGAAVIGLAPVYAEEDSDRLSLSSDEEYSQMAALDDESSQVAALDDEFSLSSEESSQVAALDESSSDEGLAGRPGEEGFAGSASRIEGSEGHWVVQTPSGGNPIDD